ncbi:E3 ubiquitin-protein ligase NHLRC1-like [Arapaima gigas]
MRSCRFGLTGAAESCRRPGSTDRGAGTMSSEHPGAGCGPLGAEALLTKIRVNLLECKVCFETFGRQRPRALPCGHVLCAKCLSLLPQARVPGFECPFCRRPCAAAHVSDCLPLSELSELLLRWSPEPQGTLGGRGGDSCTGGLATGTLQLRSAFGGWGKLVNPTAMAVSPSVGALVVTHDGENRVEVFSPEGRRLHGFGRRGRSPTEICHPLGVAVAPGGYVVVTDAGDRAVKVFTSRGHSVVVIRDSFQLPWGVVVDTRGHILVTDAQAGTLSEVAVDFGRGVTLLNRVAVADLQGPRSVACCPLAGTVVVAEHPEEQADGPRRRPFARLRIFSRDFGLLSQIDSFSLSLLSPRRLCVSAVAFDVCGDIIVADMQQGVIWSLNTWHNCPRLIPLISHGLLLPVALVASAQERLLVLDSGDHAVKTYAAVSGSTTSRQ